MNVDKFRKAQVYFQDQQAGVLEETAQGYRFSYFEEYMEKGYPISFSLPFSQMVFESEELFSFFQGLASEGWYRDVVCTTLKIDTKDDFGVLLVCGQNTIGAVTVKEIQE